MWTSLPEFGTGVLCAILVAAAYTFGVALAAGTGRPRLLQAARVGAYGTISLVGLAVLVLAYAFVSHDFRLDYVQRYSDRTMTTPWLLAALWGGQDGSLLWWLFLTSLFSGICVAWLKGRYRQLQPFVIATQMSVLIFLALLMLFATNPFRTLVSGAVPDGQGLNHQLRTFYMIIHPPSLYIGFTSCAVPFSFAIAALATGRLDNEWIIATRKWMLFSWMFLAIGNCLGMLWAYHELGWGGYWAWDPVENAAFLPFLTSSAYVHSVMIQERRGMLRMWNIILICLTFFLTYFGTWLTRSGLIASVHSFAQSGIGIWFAAYMVVIVAVCTALIVWRHVKLRSLGQFDSILSREVAFVVNNWILLTLLFFIAGATLYPRISELFHQPATVGPPFYNTFIPPIALLLIFLMGTAPLLGWRKTSKELFYKSFRFPVAAGVAAAIAHVLLGKSLGFPPFVPIEPIYEGAVGHGIAWLIGRLPVVTVALVAYNIAVVLQEFQRGIAARQTKREATGEGFFLSLYRLVSRSRRRYGGYIVHVGISIMFLGFAGRAWESMTETSLEPGETVSLEEYDLTYTGVRTELDHEKRMVFVDLDVKRHGEPVGTISPAKYIYKAMGTQPRTVVATYGTVRDELYVSIGAVNPQSKMASLRVHVNTLVLFVWLGFGVLLIGAFVSMWPEASFQEAGAFAYVRALGTVATMVMLSLLLALYPSKAYGQQHEMRREGVVEQSPTERALFKRMLCDCGGCAHEPLETCTCPWAHEAREWARGQLASGLSSDAVVKEYASLHGSDSVIVQANTGINRVLWAVPLSLAVIVGGFVSYRVFQWSRRGAQPGKKKESAGTKKRDDYDDKLDAELRALDNEDV